MHCEELSGQKLLGCFRQETEGDLLMETLREVTTARKEAGALNKIRLFTLLFLKPWDNMGITWGYMDIHGDTWGYIHGTPSCP